MKVVISSQGENSQAKADTRFGRAQYFMVYDEAGGNWECIPNNQNLEAAHGAGIQAGQNVARMGAAVLITGHVGPKAFKVLEAAHIAMYSFGIEGKTVEAVLKEFQAGKLPVITSPGEPQR